MGKSVVCMPKRLSLHRVVTDDAASNNASRNGIGLPQSHRCRMSAHTPGPWVLKDETLRASNGRQVEVYGAGLALLGLPTKEAKANTHLIVAAPKMAYMLAEIYERLEGFEDIEDGAYGDPSPNWAMRMRQEIAEVYAEATGEQP